MKLKRVAFVLVVAVLSLSTVLTGCKPKNPVDPDAVLESISINTDGLKTTYTVGETFDAGNVKFTAHYSDKNKKTVSLTEQGVTYKFTPALTMSENKYEFTADDVGDLELEVSYKVKEVTKKDTVDITVEEAPVEQAELNDFALPTVYANYVKMYQTTHTPNSNYDDDDEDSDYFDVFMKGAGTYTVGNLNGFVFTPDAHAWNDADKLVSVSDVDTTFKLYVDGAATAVTDPSAYVTVKEGQRNTYYFTSAAAGHTFKLEITAVDGKYDVSELTSATIAAEFEVVEGYNVYDQFGLSVYDNLNKKNWAQLKDRKLDWDEKKLSEYDVSCIVLHNDITINPDYLPDYYFWDSKRTEIDQQYNAALTMTNAKYRSQLDGSLRSYSSNKNSHDFNFDDDSFGAYKEAYSSCNVQKALYNTSGCNIQGNCMQIDYQLTGNTTNHKLYTVFDGKAKATDKDDEVGKNSANPTSYWSMFRHVKNSRYAEDYVEHYLESIKMENLRIKGSMRRQAKTDGEPAQLMCINSTVPAAIENCIISQLYVAFTGDNDGAQADISLKDVKITDFYSNMFYLWKSTARVENSVLTAAGGPIFIMSNGSSVFGTPDDESGSHLILDDKSIVESWAAGLEPWYQLNKASALFTMVKGDLRSLFKALGRDYVNVVNDDEEGLGELVNIMAVVVPDPSDITSSYTSDDKMPQVIGTIVRNNADATVEKYVMNPAFPSADTLLGMGLPQEQVMAMLYSPKTQTPFFSSGSLITAIAGTNLQSAQIFGMNTKGTSPAEMLHSGLAGARAVWAAEANVSDLLLLTMRALPGDTNNNMRSPSPRFGILIGNSHVVTA